MRVKLIVRLELDPSHINKLNWGFIRVGMLRRIQLAYFPTFRAGIFFTTDAQ